MRTRFSFLHQDKGFSFKLLPNMRKVHHLKYVMQNSLLCCTTLTHLSINYQWVNLDAQLYSENDNMSVGGFCCCSFATHGLLPVSGSETTDCNAEEEMSKTNAHISGWKKNKYIFLNIMEKDLDINRMWKCLQIMLWSDSIRLNLNRTDLKLERGIAVYEAHGYITHRMHGCMWHILKY